MRILLILPGLLVLAACAAQPTPTSPPGATPTENPVATATSIPVIPISPTQTVLQNPYTPQLADTKLTSGLIFLDSAEIVILESYPIQVNLHLEGSLPTPCNQMRVNVSQPDEQKIIRIEAYSVVDPNTICIEVLRPFDATIPLGSFPSGHYSVWVNGSPVGEFDA